ncbi:hypothetical protein [Salipaludibacillus sp. CF4.18]|uniref:hypothetical protein n=1 Tax=Salipaludibacillus sp. CF4.18 TaxID=3373081 RepID=UPI003EE4E680
MNKILPLIVKNKPAAKMTSKAEAGTVILFGCQSTTYQLMLEREEEVFKIVDFLHANQENQGIEGIEILTVSEFYHIKVSYFEGQKYSSFDDLKAAILSDEFFLDLETGIHLSPQDISFTYTMEVHQVPFGEGDCVPFGDDY